MNGSTSSPDASGRDEIMSALFAHLVTQHANLALMYLGRVPHPETGQPVVDLEAARLFIDQLEMIEAKTKGNLVPAEAKLLHQSLAAVRMAFVDAVNHPSTTAEPAPSTAPAATPETAAPPASPDSTPPSAADAASASSDEARKRFSKKY